MKTSDDKVSNLWEEHFPQFADTKDPTIQRIIRQSRHIEIPNQFQVSAPGVDCNDYVLMVSGSIRVQVVTDGGREIVLYRVGPGEGCILTTSCLLSSATFPAESHTEEKTEILALPAAQFDKAIASSSQFRHFVFNNFAQRLASVMTRIEQLCLPAIDRNLAVALLQLSNNTNQPITATHQQLANELGTAREVVSRHLKQFEHKGFVSLGRGTIIIISPEELEKIVKVQSS